MNKNLLSKVKYLSIAWGALLLGIPRASRADTSTLKELIDNFAEIIGTSVVSLLSGAALAAFIFGMVRLIAAQGDANKRSEAKKWVFWGFLGMFFIVALWGVVKFVAVAFGIGIGGTAPTPAIHIQS